jgi:hypothetical protein
MAAEPVALLSYSHFDDEHEHRWLTKMREALEQELQAQTGRQFRIFQDRPGIEWGEAWREKLKHEARTTAFLIPVVTPSFLESDNCRAEVEHFLEKERVSGRSDLILPIYLISARKFDEPAANDDLVVRLRAHQFIDWQKLRAKSTTSVAFKKEIIRLANRFAEALARYERTGADSAVARQVAPVRPDTAAAAGRPTPAHPDTSDDELLRAATGGEPLAAAAVVVPLARRQDLHTRLVAHPPVNPIAEATMQEILASDAPASAELLMTRIRGVGPMCGWHEGIAAASCFSPPLRPHCVGELLSVVSKSRAEREQRRLAFCALGRCADPIAGGTLLDQVHDRDTGHELGLCLCEALARMLVRSPQPEDLLSGVSTSTAAARLAEALRKAEELNFDAWPDRLRRLLRFCDGRHADAIVSNLLQNGTTIAKSLAANALGDCGIVRAVRHLIEMAESSSEVSVVKSCSSALGHIGTPAALSWILAAPVGSEQRYGLIFGLDRVGDAEFLGAASAYLKGSSPLKHLALRAAGVRGARVLEETVRCSLDSNEPIERGAAFLSLARMGTLPSDEARVGMQQAGDPDERVLACLARLTVDPAAYPELEATLRTNLVRGMSFAWLNAMQQE